MARLSRNSEEWQAYRDWAWVAMHAREVGYRIFRRSGTNDWIIKPRNGGIQGDTFGATAAIYHQNRRRVTVTRVVLGTMVAGFPGALVGSMAGKTNVIIFVAIRLANGKLLTAETKAPWEGVMHWVSEFNRLSSQEIPGSQS